MKNFTLSVLALLLFCAEPFAQTNCLNWSDYVDSKNEGTTEYYKLVVGSQEKAAQTYHYSGYGNVTGARLEGRIADGSKSITLKLSIYNVDANNRPTTIITNTATKTITWYYWEHTRTVHFGSGGIPLNKSFAIVAEISGFSGQQFEIKYTGDGDGRNEDLPSVAGSSTGGNWKSLLPSNDGDLYLSPQLNHFIVADFAPGESCEIDVNETINFDNLSQITSDSMFNTITLSDYSGSMPLYQWDFGDQSGTSTLKNPSYSYSSAGVYTVKLTTYIDDWPMKGTFCSDTRTMQISVGLNVSATPTHLGCNGDQSGAIKLSASGGDNSMYLYSLDQKNWQSSSSFTDLKAGSYAIFVKDAIGCERSGTLVNLTEPGAISISSPMSITLATCGKSNGAIEVSASGGSGTLKYSLDNSTYQTSNTFSDLSAGGYTVYVKDANDCVQSSKTVVGNIGAPSLQLQAYTTVGCNGNEDGTITLIGTGGTGLIEYSIDGSNFKKGGKFTDIAAGEYYPTVKDAAGCIAALGSAVVITQPMSIDFDASQHAASCEGNKDGQITVSGATGGTGTLTYSIDGSSFQSGTIFSGLSAGSYTITVKDAAACKKTMNISVEEPGAVTASANASTNLTCHQSGNGSLSITAKGGNGNYMYNIDGTNFLPSGMFYGLNAKTHTVVAKDQNGCTDTISVKLTQPSAITASVTVGNSTCGNDNGTMLAMASGGSGSGYTYSINGGQSSNTTGSFKSLADSSYLILIKDGQGCEKVLSATITDSDGPTITGNTSTNITCNGGSDGSITITSVKGGTGTIRYSVDGGPFQQKNSFSGLMAGSHIVVVKDANDCTGEVEIVLTEPSAIAIGINKTDITCNEGKDGSIRVNAAGGAGTLAYSIDGLSFQSSPKFNNLTAGHYVITVKDAGQCTESASTVLNEPSKIKPTIGILDVSCHNKKDGALSANARGGVGTLKFSLDGTNYQTSGFYTNLSSGDYVLFVKDDVGCQVATQFKITEPEKLRISAEMSPVSCTGGDDGVIDITVNGGTKPYKYSWTNLAISEDIFNLSAGDYSVKVTDANSCSLVNDFTIEEPQNPMVVNGTVTNASSAGSDDGLVDITVTGGIAPYTYNWSSGQTTEDITDLFPGVYSVTVTDANECSHTTSFTVSFNIGISNVLNPEQVKVYPNPAKTILNIEITNDEIANRVELINATGQIVLASIPTHTLTPIDVSTLKTGIYFLHIYTDNGIIQRKISIAGS